MEPFSPILIIILGVLGIVVGVFVVLYVVVPLAKVVGIVLRHIFRFVFGEILDVLRLVGAIVTGIVMIPLILLNVIIGRWSASAHFGRGLGSEIKNTGLCIYRIVLGHPARLLGLTALTDGVEKRLPAMVADAPGSDTPSRRVGQFEGYKIVGSLAGGGSGGKLYVAEPDATKKAVFARAGRADVSQVVIKAFNLDDGSSMPQIVRENRALEAARNLGLVLDHELTPKRFFYVMEFVPGQSLALVTQQLHGASGPSGLDNTPLVQAMSYMTDLLRTLRTYHKGGLWHKDVKPDNIIVDGRKAHLVDFGLVTPLHSAMTLTTHGTEYFRDPELVRMALRGAKVHEVDGTRFDLYAVGAVLYSVIENSFPAHGVLSQISKRCPEALRWIVRRAMTDYDKRYADADQMIADLDFVRFAADPFAVKPFELPSMRGALGNDQVGAPPVVDPEIAAVAAAGSPRPQADPLPPLRPVKPRTAPRITLANWWTGAYTAQTPQDAGAGNPMPFQPPTLAGGGKSVPPRAAPFAAGFATPRARTPEPGGVRRSAAEQLARARARVQAARERSATRLARRGVRPTGAKPFRTGVNPGVVLAALVPVGLAAVLIAVALDRSGGPSVTVTDGMDVQISEPGSPQLWARATMPEFSADIAITAPVAPAAPDAPGAPVAVMTSQSRAPRIVEIGRPVPAPAPRADGSILVVVDMPRPLSSEHSAAAVVAAQRLGLAGFTVLGDWPGNKSAGAELTRQLDLTAQAHVACGDSAPESEETTSTLGRWLAESHAADMVLWLRARPMTQTVNGTTTVTGYGPVEYFLVAPYAAPTDSVGAEAATRRLEAGIRSLQGA